MLPFLLTIQKGSGIQSQTGNVAPGILLANSGEAISIDIPFPCQDFLFYRVDCGTFTLSSDLRLLYDPSRELDNRGVFSLLQYGACVPPLTLFKGISALAAGYRYSIRFSDFNISSSCSVQWSEPAAADSKLNAEEQVRTLSEAIRQRLAEICAD